MCDEWMPLIRLPISIDQFHQLPRNAAYKYEYLGGEAVLSPRPKTQHAALDLTTWNGADDQASADEYSLGAITPADEEELAKVFTGAFSTTQPFASLVAEERLTAARACLRRAFDGDEGPWIGDASFLTRRQSDNSIVGAILITLLPDDDASEIDEYRWIEPPPPDLWETAGGRPHITWVFTHHFFKGDGIGTRLLTATVSVLRRRGYKQLHTTFIAGNDSSMLWHWRNGFALLPSHLSKRSIRKRFKA